MELKFGTGKKNIIMIVIIVVILGVIGYLILNELVFKKKQTELNLGVLSSALGDSSKPPAETTKKIIPKKIKTDLFDQRRFIDLKISSTTFTPIDDLLVGKENPYQPDYFIPKE